MSINALEDIVNKKQVNTCLVAPGALKHHLQHCTTCKIQNGQYGAPNGRQGLERCLPPRFLGAPVNFCQISFLIQALPLWEKGHNGGKNGK